MKNLIHSSAGIILVCILFLPRVALAQEALGTITGALIEAEKGTPLRGATVRILEASAEAKTDFKGRFILKLPAMTYPGMEIERPNDAGRHVIEADLVVEAGVEDDLGEIEVPQGTPIPPEAEPLVEVEPPSAEQPPSPPVVEEKSPQQPGPGRAWFGVYMQDWLLNPDLGPSAPNNQAIRVISVFEGSPAERADLREGDLLVSLDGIRFKDLTNLRSRLAIYPPGQPARFGVFRGEQYFETDVLFDWIPQDVFEVLSQSVGTGAVPPPGPAPAPVPGNVPAPPSPPAPEGTPPMHPLIVEARRLAAEGKYAQASQKYDEYLREFPQDGRMSAEQAELVYFHIQRARGMALMAQAVRKPGLAVPERTRLRMIIAQARFESGNLPTAKQMLLEALRDDPGNPAVNGLLSTIARIEAEAAARARGQVTITPGGPAIRSELEKSLNREFGKALEKWFD